MRRNVQIFLTFLFLFVIIIVTWNVGKHNNDTSPKAREFPAWQPNCSDFVDYKVIFRPVEGVPKGNWTEVEDNEVLIKNGTIIVIFREGRFYGAIPHYFNLTSCAYKNETLFLKFQFGDCYYHNKVSSVTWTCLDIKEPPILEITPKVKAKKLVIQTWGKARYTLEILLKYPLE